MAVAFLCYHSCHSRVAISSPPPIRKGSVCIGQQGREHHCSTQSVRSTGIGAPAALCAHILLDDWMSELSRRFQCRFAALLSGARPLLSVAALHVFYVMLLLVIQACISATHDSECKPNVNVV